MSNKNLTIGLAVAIIIAVAGLFLPTAKSLFGAASPSDVSSTNFTQITANALTVNTTNAATSTTAVGCVQTTATSTATPIRLLYTASTTATAISGTQAGFVLWGYGTCPF